MGSRHRRSASDDVGGDGIVSKEEIQAVIAKFDQLTFDPTSFRKVTLGDLRRAYNVMGEQQLRITVLETHIASLVAELDVYRGMSGAD